jgi:hypothetical protein
VVAKASRAVEQVIDALLHPSAISLSPHMRALANKQLLYSYGRRRDRDLAGAGELDLQARAMRQGLQALQHLESAPVGSLWLLGGDVAIPSVLIPTVVWERASTRTS